MKISCCIVLSFVVFSCSSNHFKIKTTTLLTELHPIQTHDQMKLDFTKTEKILIHYFNGSCSSCIGEIVKMDKIYANYQNDKNCLLLISYSPDTILLAYYTDKSKISAIIMYDKEQSFFLKNNKVFQHYGNTFLINKNGKVIMSGNLINNKRVQKAYTDKLNNK